MKPQLIMIVILAATFGCDLRTSQSYFDEAFALENEGEYEEAILLLDKAIEKDPNFLGAYINRGTNKSALGKFEEAIRDYEEVMKIDPDNVLAVFNKANNLKRLEDYEEAIVFYNKAIQLKGGELLQIDWTENSTVYFEEADYDVPSVNIQYERAFAFYEIDSLDKAFTGFNYCATNNYMKKESLNEIGNLFYDSGQLDEACNYFEQAAILGSEYGEYNFNEFCRNRD